MTNEHDAVAEYERIIDLRNRRRELNAAETRAKRSS